MIADLADRAGDGVIYLTAISLSIGVAIGITTLGKKTWHGILWATDLVTMVRRVLEFVEQELTPNGGTSLRDKIDKMGICFERLSKSTASTNQLAVRNAERLKKIEEHLGTVIEAVDTGEIPVTPPPKPGPD